MVAVQPSVMTDGRVQFVVPCACCNYDYTFIVMPDQFDAWQRGEFVQSAFPNMPSEWREMLISATCPDCFNRMFRDE